MTTPAERLQAALEAEYSDAPMGHAVVRTDDLAWALDRIAALEAVKYNAARMTHAWAVLVAEIDPLPPHGPNPNRWEPDRYNAAAFVSALLRKYAALEDKP